MSLSNEPANLCGVVRSYGTRIVGKLRAAKITRLDTPDGSLMVTLLAQRRFGLLPFYCVIHTQHMQGSAAGYLTTAAHSDENGVPLGMAKEDVNLLSNAQLCDMESSTQEEAFLTHITTVARLAQLPQAQVLEMYGGGSQACLP
jgi:hypothetical protein